MFLSAFEGDPNFVYEEKEVASELEACRMMVVCTQEFNVISFYNICLA